jgi:cAMP-dependent protein kinase regulator
VPALAARSLEASIRAGDLPGAVLHAVLAIEAGASAGALHQRIAECFGLGSPRLSDSAALAPPPLPSEIELPPLFAKASGAELLDAVARAVKRAAEQKHTLKEDSKLPAWPLFSALPPPQLGALLSLLTLREHKAGDSVIQQGAEGREAFLLARGVVNVVREGGREDPRGQARLLAVLGPGALFGEMALVCDAPRAASVVAVEPTHLLAIDRVRLEQLAAADPAVGRELGNFCHNRMLSNLMRHSAVLSPLPPEARSELLERFGSRTLEPHETLLHQGDEPGCLYLIASGGVQVVSRDADGDRVVLAELGPGDVVGEISLVLRRPANADVVAVHRTVCLQLDREAFETSVRAHPVLLREIYDIAVQREEETRSIVAQEALDVSDTVLL